MVINYTLKNYQFKETTKGKGIVKYLLVDDQGNQRIVSAIANLGLGKKIKSVHPIHHRESPLIDVLFNAQINEKITVDFTEYNQKHPRGSIEARKIQKVRTDKVVDPYNESLIKDIDSIVEHKFRLLKLALTAALAVIAILFVINGFFSENF